MYFLDKRWVLWWNLEYIPDTKATSSEQEVKVGSSQWEYFDLWKNKIYWGLIFKVLSTLEKPKIVRTSQKKGKKDQVGKRRNKEKTS